MRILCTIALACVVLIAGCASGRGANPATSAPPAASKSDETSIGANVPTDDSAVPRADASGRTPDEVLSEYVRAVNASDWKTARSLHATARTDATSATPSDTPQPYEDFVVREVRVVEDDRALVRTTYSTKGVSALDGGLKPVVVAEPGEWWVMEKSDGLWRVTSKGPWD